MEQGRKTVRYDESLQREAYRFAGIKQPFPAHFHDHYVVGLIEQGTRRMCCGNREYLLWPGDMLLLNPGDTHTCEQYGKAALLDYRMLNIPTPVMEDIARDLGSPLPCFTQCVIQKSDLASQLRTLHQMILDGSNEFEKEELLFLLMEDLLTRYSRPFASCLPECREEVASVCAFLEEHYAQRITLDQLCRCANLSKSALLRAFTKYRGITPYRYLETLRINRAKALLEQGVSPVEAALQTGFSDQSHFTNYFRMFIGVAPGVYRDIFLKKEGDHHGPEK